MPDKKTITVQGLMVEVSQPYEAGHTVTEAEAKALNQVRAENIGNNVRKAINELKDDESLSDDARQKAAQKLVNEKDAGYEFTLASVGGRQTLDPLAKEARAIAKNYITGKIKESGTTIKAYLEKNGDDAIAQKVAEIEEHPEIIKAAKKAIAERQKLADAIG